MKITTRLNVKGYKGWCVIVDGIVKFDNLTLHQAEIIAQNFRLDIKNGIKI